MYLLAVLCLLSAGVALPTPEQLHTNIPESPAPEFSKSEEKDKQSNEQAAEFNALPPLPELHDAAPDAALPEPEDEAKLEQKDDDNKPNVEEIGSIEAKSKEDKKDSKEEKYDSKEQKKDSREDKKDFNEEKKDSKEERKDSKEEKKDSKEDEEKKSDEIRPVVVPLEVERPEVFNKPKPSFINFLASLFDLPSFNFPFHWFGRARDGEPVIIIRESDFDWDD